MMIPKFEHRCTDGGAILSMESGVKIIVTESVDLVRKQFETAALVTRVTVS